MGRQVDENQREKEWRKAGDKRYKHVPILSACNGGEAVDVSQSAASALKFGLLSRSAHRRACRLRLRAEGEGRDQAKPERRSESTALTPTLSRTAGEGVNPVT